LELLSLLLLALLHNQRPAPLGTESRVLAWRGQQTCCK
jgi:hypothetical protein